MKTAIGIDIGGTKISIAAGSQNGTIQAYFVLPTLKGRQSRQSIESLIAEVKRLQSRLSPKARAGLAGIGVCLPGAVDTAKGIVPHSPNLQGWKGIPLRSILSRAFKLPVKMVNDANAAAVGEMLFGAARGVKNFVYVTVSTGIGGGIILDGRLIEGAGFAAGEVGHMTIVPGGDLCNCGKRGCLEGYASGGAIERYVTARMKKLKKSGLKPFLENGRVTARGLSQAARAGNPLAREAFEHAGFYLGVGLANLLNILNPELIVLGGGVIHSAPPAFWKKMRQSLRADAWPEAYRSAKISKTALHKNAGNLGAIAVILHGLH